MLRPGVVKMVLMTLRRLQVVQDMEAQDLMAITELYLGYTEKVLLYHFQYFKGKIGLSTSVAILAIYQH